MTLKEMRDCLIEYADSLVVTSDTFIIKSKVTVLRKNREIVQVFKRNDTIKVFKEGEQVVIQVGDKTIKPTWNEFVYRKWMEDNCRAV